MWATPVEREAASAAAKGRQTRVEKTEPNDHRNENLADMQLGVRPRILFRHSISTLADRSRLARPK